MRTIERPRATRRRAAAASLTRCAAFLSALTALAASPVAAQQPAGDTSAPPRTTAAERPDGSSGPDRPGAPLHAVGIWLAHAGSTVDAPYGHSPGWSVTLAGARASWRLAGSERLTVLYTMDLIPGARLSAPSDAAPAICRRTQRCIPTEEPAYGLGASPLGLQIGYQSHEAIRLHGGFTAGGMWFTERVPVTTASRMNFTVDVGAGISLVRQDGMGATLGYRIHHISNGWTARANPGIGAHMLTLGIDWGR